MNKEKMITHRCKELLDYNKNNDKGIFIRKDYQYSFDVPNNQFGWWLSHIAYDLEWESTYKEKVCKITYCPFCGKELL